MLHFHPLSLFPCLASTELAASMQRRPLASVPMFLGVCTAIFECEELKNAHGKLEALHGRLGHLEVKGAKLACLQLVFCAMRLHMILVALTRENVLTNQSMVRGLSLCCWNSTPFSRCQATVDELKQKYEKQGAKKPETTSPDL